MSEQYNKNRILSSLFWKLMERGGTQGIQFVVQIVLARLLSPEEFGIIAVVLVFIHLAQVFVQSGFQTALIQKKEADEKDFSSIFYLNLVVAGILYGLIYLGAPYIASFYHNVQLRPLLRVLSIILFTGALNAVQNAYVARHLLFKKLFKSSLGAMIISGVFGIVAAYAGLGVWALVIQQILNQLTISVILWFTVKWRPQFVFSLARVRILFRYGWKLLASALLQTIYLELRTLIVGRNYSAATLGYYNRGEQFPKLIVTNIDGAIQSVMLPTLSAHQEDRQRVKAMMRRSIVTSSFLIFPMMAGMAAVAEPLVRVVLTEKWLDAVPFLQIFAVSYALIPIHTANLQAINALGRSDIFLKLEVVKKVMGMVILVASLPFGVYAIALGQVFASIISSFINAAPNKGMLDYRYKEQWKDMLPAFLMSLCMGGAVFAMNALALSPMYLLLLQVLVGAVLYLGLAVIFKVESFFYILDVLKKLRKS